MKIHVYVGVAAALLLLLLLSPPAQARAPGFIGDYSTWKDVPPKLQIIYLQGVLDSWMQIEQKSDPDKLKARRAGNLSCFVKRNFDANMALELVNSHYKAYPVDWQYAPSVVLYFEINSMCLPDINEEREKLGLPPNQRLPRQLANDTP